MQGVQQWHATLALAPAVAAVDSKIPQFLEFKYLNHAVPPLFCFVVCCCVVHRELVARVTDLLGAAASLV